MNGTLKSTATGRCVGVEAHWLWPQPMVSLMGCTGAASVLKLDKTAGTLLSASGYGCIGVSATSSAPPSTLWYGPGLQLGTFAPSHVI
eukprot:SAG22_NODE_63_length_23302_cov_17.506551_9_plen_88_part_00